MYNTSFDVNERKEYFRGEMYYIQKSHTGKSYRFLKKPEKSINGSSTKGVAAETDLASVNILPSSRPNEFPAKLTKKVIK
jgi:hypothetical protein